MEVTIEYLAIFRRTDTFCNSAASFIRLLHVDSEVRVSDDGIYFQGEHLCSFQVSDGKVAAKEQRYFHLHFTWDGDPDLETEKLEHFIALLKRIRTIVAQAGGETETLWDELSFHNAKKAYPLINEIENLMRRLIANFMLITVGREWAQETLPKAVEEALKHSKRNDYLNILHQVDFIQLGDFLFEPYSKRTPQELFAKIKDVKTAEDAKALLEFIPESNWKRYFAGLIACEDGYLKTRWEKLYYLRCKVAHNAFITGKDLEEIRTLVLEIKPKLKEAIAELSKVTVPTEEMELVAESAARNVNAMVGEFIAHWQQLEAAIDSRMEARGRPRSPQYNGHELVREGLLESSLMEIYDQVCQVRDSIVHGPFNDFPVETIREFLKVISILLTYVEEASYIDYLMRLPEQERQTEIDSRVADTHDEIADSDDFAGAIAETNATGYSIEDYSIEEIHFDQDQCVAKIAFSSTGDQLEDKPYCGNEINGEAEAVFDADGRLEYRNITAEVDHSWYSGHEQPEEN